MYKTTLPSLRASWYIILLLMHCAGLIQDVPFKRRINQYCLLPDSCAGKWTKRFSVYLTQQHLSYSTGVAIVVLGTCQSIYPGQATWKMQKACANFYIGSKVYTAC